MESQIENEPIHEPLPAQAEGAGPRPPTRHRAAKAIASIMALVLILALLFYTPMGNMLMSEMTGRSFARSATLTWNREITISTSREISYYCDIPVPPAVTFSGINAQEVSQITFEPLAREFSKSGGSWIEWTGVADSRVTLRIGCRATVNTVIWDIDHSNSGMASDIHPGEWAGQIDDEWEIADASGEFSGEFKIWPSHPAISGLAHDLTSADRTVYENVKQIYEFMRIDITYSTVPGSEAKSCLQTLEGRSGDCDDQSILLISLLRSIGVPSWLVFGTLYDARRDEWGAHAWVELYIPLKESGGETVVIDPANGEFLVRNCNRLEEWKSDGVGEHLADYYSLLSYNFTMRPNQPPPVVTIQDSYSGDYQASRERVYGSILCQEGNCLATDTERVRSALIASVRHEIAHNDHVPGIHPGPEIWQSPQTAKNK